MILQAGTFTQSKIENTHILRYLNEIDKGYSDDKDRY